MSTEVQGLRFKRNRDGSLNFYWEPTPKLRAAGWRTRALGNDPVAAQQAALAIVAEVAAWRANGKPKRPEGTRATTGAEHGTVRQLIELYKNPPGQRPIDPDATAEEHDKQERGIFRYDYRSLTPNTRRDYDSCLRIIDKQLGPFAVSAVTQHMIQKCLTEIAENRHAYGPLAGQRKHAHAHAVQRVGRLLWHASRSLVPPRHPCYVAAHLNPWAKIGMRSAPRRKPVLWTREARDLIVAAAIKLDMMSVGVAIILNWWMGQREGDVLALSHNFNPGDIVNIVQSKTAGEVFLDLANIQEIGDAIEALRDDQRRRRLSGVKLLVDERNGLTWTEDRFRKAFDLVRSVACEEASWSIRHRQAGWQDRDASWVDKHLRPLTFMRLRHTAVTLLFEAGASLGEIAAITGHTLVSVTQIVERYGQRTAVTSRNAIAKRLAKEQRKGESDGINLRLLPAAQAASRREGD